MLTKHYLAKAYMNRENESMFADLIGIPLQLTYAVGWGVWHDNSILSSLDTGKIDLQNCLYYRKRKMTAKDCRKASKITLKIYEAMIKSSLFTNISRDKQYYSHIYDRYYENIDLAHVFVCIHDDKKLKDEQEIRIQFDANQVKAIQSDQYLTVLNQVLASIDDNLIALAPSVVNGWYIYKIKDNSVNYRINLSNFHVSHQGYSVYLDGGHEWNLSKEYGGLISGASGTGKTSLLFSMIYQLMQKQNVSVYVADGKNDMLGAVMSQILPRGHVVTGTDTANLIHDMVQLTDKRYADMSVKRKKNPQMAFADFSQFGFKLIAVFIDEQSAVNASLADSKARKQYQSDLMKLVQTSRAAGIVPIISMQQASANAMGGTLGTAIREQVAGLKIIMGTANTITSQDRQMVWGNGVELPSSKFTGVGTGFIQTSNMPVPESFQAPLMPSDSEKLNKLLQRK